MSAKRPRQEAEEEEEAVEAKKKSSGVVVAGLGLAALAEKRAELQRKALERSKRKEEEEEAKTKIPPPPPQTTTKPVAMAAAPLAATATAAVNRRVQGARMMDAARAEAQAEAAAAAANPHWDRRVRTQQQPHTQRRARRAFAFFAAAEPRKQHSEEEKEKGEEEAKEEEEVAAKVPDVEWWDAPFLRGVRVYPAELAQAPAAETLPSLLEPLPAAEVLAAVRTVLYEKTTALVERPPRRESPLDARAASSAAGSQQQQMMMLTKEERRKLRRRTRQERLRERNEAVMVGLQPPPPPKIKLSNMMRVLTSEAVQDPTAIERRVREEAAARKQYRDGMNEARKLTPEQRWEKHKRRIEEDTARHGYYAAAFHLTSGRLDDKRRRFKVIASARKLMLRGCAIAGTACCLVVAEGGPRAIKLFKRAMLRRIKWNVDAPPLLSNATTTVMPLPPVALSAEEDSDSDDMSDDEEDSAATTAATVSTATRDPTKMCTLLWEGAVLKPSFKTFTVEGTPDHLSDAAARRFLQQHSAEHFWDLARNHIDAANV